jgi:hypothetical protein
MNLLLRKNFFFGLKAMVKNKALGPGGIHVEFYQALVNS